MDNSSSPLPRPRQVELVRCPSCGHAINLHSRLNPNCMLNCPCKWDPNDIAAWLIYGGLSR